MSSIGNLNSRHTRRRASDSRGPILKQPPGPGLRLVMAAGLAMGLIAPGSTRGDCLQFGERQHVVDLWAQGSWARRASVMHDGTVWRMMFITTFDESGQHVPADGQAHVVSAISPDGISWTVSGVVLSPDQPWASLHLLSTALLRHGATYYLYVVGYPGNTIGLATSEDGESWSWHSSNPVLQPPGIHALGSVLYNEELSRFEMWYTSGGSSWAPFVLSFATSADGVSWTVHEPAVLSYDESTLFDENSVSVIRADGQYELYFGSHQNDIRRATSPDGISWSLDEQCNPVLAPQSGQWDSAVIRWPSMVSTSDGQRVLYYTGDAGEPTLGAIGRAVVVLDGACCGDAGCRLIGGAQATSLGAGEACAAFVCDVREFADPLLYPFYQQCLGDVDFNGVVNAADRGAISANFGQTHPTVVCRFDLDGNGVINAADRGIVSANIGLCAPLPPFMSGGPDTRFGETGTFLGIGTTCGDPSTWLCGNPPWILRSSTCPTERANHLMISDPPSGNTYLLGGATVSAGIPLGDFWMWNGHTWTQLADPPFSPRGDFGMAYDSVRRRIVIFGGGDYVQFFAETWEYDIVASVWTQRAVGGPGPSAREECTLSYDEARDVMVLFGGSDGTYYSDTWEYSTATGSWTLRESVGPMAARFGQAGAYDPDRGMVVIFGGTGLGSTLLGDTWGWNGTTWSLLAATGPSARDDSHMVWDGENIVLFYGWDGDGRDDVWEWDGSEWAQWPVTGGPGARWDHSIVYDPPRGEYLLFGGWDNAFEYGDTWTLFQPGNP